MLLHTYTSLIKTKEAPLSPTDRAMCLVSSNLANYHATVQKLLIRQVLTKQLCISPVYRRLAVAKFSEVHNAEIAHVTLTTPNYETLTHHKTKTLHGRPMYKI